jgi:signal transduction histidine kinase
MWLAFAAAALVVMAAMGWTTAAVLRLDRRAQLEENVRLALWRMDSALGPLIAAEQARPPEDYFSDVGAVDALALLLGKEAPFIASRFECEEDGTMRYPLGPKGTPPGMEPLRSGPQVPQMVLDAAGPLVAEPPRLADVTGRPAEPLPNAEPYQQQARNRSEYQARVQNNVAQQMAARAVEPSPERRHTFPGLFKPLWYGNTLIMVRRYGDAEGRVQGCFINWRAVKGRLLDVCKDLLPTADLVPADPAAPDPDARLLASLPVRLVPGTLPGAWSPLRVSLAIAWACVLLATAAAALLLRGVVSLSERRGAFVSAVTHELRTPLTTLRMYTEMLEGGMVADPAQRQNYLATLRAEADRLGHLVENVLAYSRLERNRAGYEVTVLKLADILPRIAERLAERARQAGMELVVEIPAEGSEQPVRTNALALEQILFNLIDNACKYAAGAADRRIHLSGAARGQTDTVSLEVRDHGPGVAPALAGRLFHPFSKSVQEAANTAPGLGLGLSLSRRLARSMGGELKLLDGATGGAAFAVTLPRA